MRLKSLLSLLCALFSLFTLAAQEKFLTPYLFVEGGDKKWVGLPDFSYGFIAIPDLNMYIPAPFMTISDDEPEGAYIRFGAGVYGPSFLSNANSQLEIGGMFFSESLRSSINSFVTEAILPQLNGGTFEVDFNFLATGNFKRDYIYQEGFLALQLPFYEGPEHFPFLLIKTFDLSMNQFKQTYGISLYDSTNNVMLTDQKEYLITNYYEAGGGFKIRYGMPYDSMIFLEGAGYYAYAKTTFISNQIATDFFPADMHQHVSQHAGKFKASAGLEKVLKRFLFSFIGRYEYWNYIPTVINAQTPLVGEAYFPRPATTGETTLQTYSFGLKVQTIF